MAILRGSSCSIWDSWRRDLEGGEVWSRGSEKRRVGGVDRRPAVMLPDDVCRFRSEDCVPCFGRVNAVPEQVIVGILTAIGRQARRNARGRGVGETVVFGMCHDRRLNLVRVEPGEGRTWKRG